MTAEFRNRIPRVVSMEITVTKRDGGYRRLWQDNWLYRFVFRWTGRDLRISGVTGKWVTTIFGSVK